MALLEVEVKELAAVDEPLRIAVLLATSELSMAWITWKADTRLIWYEAGLLAEASVRVAVCGLSVAVAVARGVGEHGRVVAAGGAVDVDREEALGDVVEVDALELRRALAAGEDIAARDGLQGSHVAGADRGGLDRGEAVGGDAVAGARKRRNGARGVEGAAGRVGQEGRVALSRRCPARS